MDVTLISWKALALAQAHSQVLLDHHGSEHRLGVSLDTFGKLPYAFDTQHILPPLILA